jgi:hypothetical protein
MAFKSLLEYRTQIASVLSGKPGTGLVAVSAYLAGAHYGPAAGETVRAYGPTVLETLAKFLGG